MPRRTPKSILEEVPNIVKDLKIGNTTIRIANNYCWDKTREDGDAAMKRIADEVGPAYFAAMEAKMALVA